METKPDIIGYPTASALRDCLREQAKTSVLGRVRDAVVRFGGAGGATLDGCDCTGVDIDGEPASGRAWVRVAQIARADITGLGQRRAGAIRATRCASPWLITYDLGITRCYPTTPDGSALPATLVDTTAQGLLADQWAIMRAIDCCKKLDDHSGVEFVSLTALGPAGGCAGNTATIRVVQVRG